MEWVKDFYEKQYNWTYKYTDFDRKTLLDSLVKRLERYCDNPAKRILELGGGNGQFAVAAAKRGYDITVIELVPSCTEHTYSLAENIISKIIYGLFKVISICWS